LISSGSWLIEDLSMLAYFSFSFDDAEDDLDDYGWTKSGSFFGSFSRSLPAGLLMNRRSLFL
jgi:hypothetical protein